MARLQGKVAIVTGAGQGMGAEIARLFAAEGAMVCATDIRDSVHEVAREIGGDAMSRLHDVSHEGDWEELVAAVRQAYGRIDILVNNAGIFAVSGPMTALTRVDWDRMMDINLFGAWLGLKHVVPAMAPGGPGAVVNVASIAAMGGYENMGPYAVSKWALRGLAKSAAVEFGALGVRVNTIFPGTIDTAMGRAGDEDEVSLQARFSRQPIARIGSTRDIAQAALFLASDESSYLTGTEVVVDGGQTVGSRKPG